MGEEQRQAVVRLLERSETFRSAILGASTAEEAVRIAGEHGIAATLEDFTRPVGDQLSDTDLEQAVGGIGPTWSQFACMYTVDDPMGCG